MSASLALATSKFLVCKECGSKSYVHRYADFCTPTCRHAWNNRRHVRGAELYDLFMTCRFDRPLARTLKIWGMLARLATHYREEDRIERQARPSWNDVAEIVDRRPYLRARVLDRGSR